MRKKELVSACLMSVVRVIVGGPVLLRVITSVLLWAQVETAIICLRPVKSESSVTVVINNEYIACSFPGGSYGKESTCNAGDPASIPGSGRSPGEGNGNPPQYSCLENTVDSGAWQATVHRVAKSQTRLND